MNSKPSLILASSSAYRQMLLGRLGLDFSSVSPDIDELSLAQEMPEATALRLAEAKARKVAETETTALIIGSDQVAVMGEHILGKPGNHQAAASQLEAMSGKTVVFHTALCLFNARSGQAQLANVPTTVRFRRLDAAQIGRYLQQDRPYDCAGSAKIEALGISLVESVDSTDPTALIGLPLIALVDMLQREGVSVP